VLLCAMFFTCLFNSCILYCCLWCTLVISCCNFWFMDCSILFQVCCHMFAIYKWMWYSCVFNFCFFLYRNFISFLICIVCVYVSVFLAASLLVGIFICTYFGMSCILKHALLKFYSFHGTGSFLRR
jgi:hypothetical protein